MVYRFCTSAGIIACASALVLGGCGNSGSGSAGLTTASLLDGAPSAQEDGIKLRNDDPMARPTQVAWTSARAQRCGFNFDAGSLKQTYLAFEARQPGAQIPAIEKAYDQTFTAVKNVVAAPDYCTDKKTAAIKGDLSRHLAGDYAPRFPVAKPQPSGGLFDGFANNTPDKFNPNTFWQDQEDKKNGVRRAE